MASMCSVKPPTITKIESVKVKASDLSKPQPPKATANKGAIATAGKGEKKTINGQKDDNPRNPPVIQLEEEEEDGMEIVKKLDFEEEEETMWDSGLGERDYGDLLLDYDEQESDSGNETQVSFL